MSFDLHWMMKETARLEQANKQQSEDQCPVDAKNDESESPEQHITLAFELPQSLAEALQLLASTQAETNILLQRLLLALLTEGDEAEMPREDMEGRPIRDS